MEDEQLGKHDRPPLNIHHGHFSFCESCGKSRKLKSKHGQWNVRRITTYTVKWFAAPNIDNHLGHLTLIKIYLGSNEYKYDDFQQRTRIIRSDRSPDAASNTKIAIAQRVLSHGAGNSSAGTQSARRLTPSKNSKRNDVLITKDRFLTHQRPAFMSDTTVVWHRCNMVVASSNIAIASIIPIVYSAYNKKHMNVRHQDWNSAHSYRGRCNCLLNGFFNILFKIRRTPLFQI